MRRADFFKVIAIDCDVDKILASLGLDEGGKVQKFVDSECLRLTNVKMPKDQNTLIESGGIHTKIGSGEIIYRTPYARRWYYMPAKFQGAPERGNYAFERMKQQHREQILKGAQKVANGG